MRMECEWTLGVQNTREDLPDVWVPASVPGGAQLDYARAQGWEDLHYGQNVRRFDGLEEKYWRYRTRVSLPPLPIDQELFFVAKGVDYAFEILINGRVHFAQEGMFTPVDLNVTDLLRDGDSLEVLIHPAPKRPGASAHTREEADQCVKPAVSYGWDWHPYLVVLGIWDECYLELRPKERIAACEMFYTLNGDFSSAGVRFECRTTSGAPVTYTLCDPEGREVYRGLSPAFDLERPALWWCRGQGEPALYVWRAELPNGHAVQGRVGFRHVALTVNANDWAGHQGTRAFPPFTLTLNGRPVFAKGSNWVNSELFPGTITRETYRTPLRLAADANFNLLRVWGGAIVNKDCFFDLCDELGLMVWQEFPLACNNYLGTPHYLKVLEQEAVSILRRVRGHACHALWGGGNELFNGWSRMTDQSLALRLLNKLCYEQDRDKPFIPTSPIMGVSHGYYRFCYPEGTDVFQAMQKKRMSAYVEFGVPSMPDADSLRTFIPPDELFPPEPGASYEFHHAFNAWGERDNWLQRDLLARYFPGARTLEELCEQTQWLQCEGYKAMFEEARRQKPRCSMALNWCYNEPWKTAANNSILTYPALPKKTYYAVAESCRDVCLSLRIPKFDWAQGEEIALEPWVLNDSPKALDGFSVRILLRYDGREVLLGEWRSPASPANENVCGQPVRARVPRMAGPDFEVIAACAEDEGLGSAYRLLYRG